MKLTKQNDKSDRRCALENQGATNCAPLGEGDTDWCYGCKFFVCEAHAQNGSLMGSHDVMEHLDSEDEEDTYE